MKLFQQMLVAGTALSLIAPIAAQASDFVNIEEMSSYIRSKKKSSRLDSKSFTNKVSANIENPKGGFDSLQVKPNQFEAGGFSDTTTLDGKAVMWIGAVDGADEIGESEALSTGYTYTMNLNTSFTGDDNLYIRLKSGANADVWDERSTYHIETKDNNDQFRLDKMWYTFPVGDKITAFVGPRIENYYMYITPSIYKPGALKSFKLGGNSNFGASTDVGFGFKYETDGGFGFASNLVDKGADNPVQGMLTQETVRKWDTQIAYTADRWHISAFVSDEQNWSSHSYNATTLARQVASDSIGYSLRGYWMPEESGTAVPEITVGYDVKSYDDVVAPNNVTEASSYMVGLTWKDMIQPDDRIGLAFTQPLKATEFRAGAAQNEVDPFIWELYYAFKPNDSMEIRPAIFGGTDVMTDEEDDIFGILTTATFKF